MSKILMKMIKLIFLFQLFFMANCSHIIQCKYKDGAKEYYELDKISENGNTQKINKFSSFPIEKQIDIYLFAMNCPDDPRIGPYLYEDGEKKIPNIVRRVQTTEKIWDKADLVQSLIGINAKCHCIFADSEIIKTLEEVEKKLDADKNIPNDYEYKKIYDSTLNSLKEQINGQNK